MNFLDMINTGSNRGVFHCAKSVRIRKCSGLYFPPFGPNRRVRSISPYSFLMRENANQNNSEHEHFSRRTLSKICEKAQPYIFHRSFPLRISSVNVTKSTVSRRFDHIENFLFLCSDNKDAIGSCPTVSITNYKHIFCKLSHLQTQPP